MNSPVPGVRICLQPSTDGRITRPIRLTVSVQMGDARPAARQELAAERKAREWLRDRMAMWSRER